MSLRIGFVSTYPPTYCGIATFTASLMSAIENLGSYKTSVIRLMDSPTAQVSIFNTPEIISTLRAGVPEAVTEAIKLLNGMDIAIIQHEFGIYGGEDGDEVVTLLKRLRVPSIVVLHTVLSSPTKHQEIIFNEICNEASALVTMSIAARDRLMAKYVVNATKVSVVPHGARALPEIVARIPHQSPLILTWGLIGPGKGIEWAIKAMSFLSDLRPTPIYVIAGRTHPKVLDREGDTYRQQLQKEIDDLHLTDSVFLRSEYLNDADLAALVASSTLVLLPYDSSDQVTSGVLIEAVTARKPVVATQFPHAIELLASGAGVVVPHRNPEAIAREIRRILVEPNIAAEMSRQSGAFAAELLWPAVAARYIELAITLIRAEAAA